MKKLSFWDKSVPECLVYWILMVIVIGAMNAFLGFEMTILSMVTIILIITWKKYCMENIK